MQYSEKHQEACYTFLHREAIIRDKGCILERKILGNAHIGDGGCIIEESPLERKRIREGSSLKGHLKVLIRFVFQKQILEIGSEKGEILATCYRTHLLQHTLVC